MLFFFKKVDSTALSSSNSDVPENGGKVRSKERSISPDSIDSVSDTELRSNNFCDENLISSTHAAYVPCSDSAEHEICPAVDQPFSLSASRDLASQTVEENAASASLLRLYFEDTVSPRNLSNSWNCYSKSRSNRAEIFRSSSEKLISLDDPIGSCTGPKDLDDNLIDRNSRTGQNSKSVIRSGKDMPATLRPAEELCAQRKAGAVGNSECQASFLVGPCIVVFSCDKISVSCQKLFLENILQLTLTFSHSDTSGFANTSVSIVSSSAQFLNAKVCCFQNFSFLLQSNLFLTNLIEWNQNNCVKIKFF